MFVCPKCGFKDSPCWRSSHWRRYSVYCRLDELEVWEPEIAKQLKDTTEWVEIGPYLYKVSRTGIVNRTTPGMGKAEFQTHGFTEKPKDPFQKKLVEGS